jgi:hypothetical protein
MTSFLNVRDQVSCPQLMCKLLGTGERLPKLLRVLCWSECVTVCTVSWPCFPGHVDSNYEQQPFVTIESTQPAMGILWTTHLHLENIMQSYFIYGEMQEHVVEQLVEALCYKPEGLRFDSWWCHWNFSLT